MKCQILQDKKIATLTLGCKVNQYETDGMRELLEVAGSQLVDFGECADVYIVNTCSVTNMAERKSRQMLHKAKHKNPEAVVVAVGCYVQTVPQEVLDDLAVDLVIGNNCKKNIVSILEDYFIGLQQSIYSTVTIQTDLHTDTHAETAGIESEHAVWVSLEKETEYEELSVSHMQEHTRAYVKIQDGCNQFCSYCIIPYVRGRIRSRSETSVLEEVRQLADKGCKEVVLTGIHLSSYGKDWDATSSRTSGLDGTALLHLIQNISRIEGILRIRLGSLEPRIITEEFVQGIQKLPKLCPHFHLSLQSACNDTLKRMNRKYTIEEYKESCDRLRQAYDRPAITTDVIVGFPGETQEEFQTTVQNLETLNLYEIHVFKYSKRRGTVAEGMPGQVQEQEKNRRSDILLELTARQKQAYEESFLGEEVRVLVEEEKKNSEEDSSAKVRTYIGHTERYMKVELQSGEDVVNRVVAVRYEG